MIMFQNVNTIFLEPLVWFVIASFEIRNYAFLNSFEWISKNPIYHLPWHFLYRQAICSLILNLDDKLCSKINKKERLISFKITINWS